jgi:uncharacterized protein YqhQ
MEGVMMRGATSWAVAVRKPDGEIEVDVNEAPTWAQRYSKFPLLRGVVALAESMSLGIRALTWSAHKAADDGESEPMTRRQVVATVGGALIFFSLVFMVLPGLVAKLAGDRLAGTVEFNVFEGVVKMAMFLGYIAFIGRMPDIRRVFQYHGAEHKAIAAYENDVPLTPESAQRFTTAHVRCGTNFLLTVLVIAIVVYSLIGRPALPYLILSRIVLIPIIAGIAYELIRLAAKHMDKRWVQRAMVPGLTLQKLTTREPTLDQLEVAIAALRAVFTSEQTEEVDARVAA